MPFYLREGIRSKRRCSVLDTCVGANKKPDREVGVQVGNIVGRLLHGSTFIIVQHIMYLTTSITTCRLLRFEKITSQDTFGYTYVHF